MHILLKMGINPSIADGKVFYPTLVSRENSRELLSQLPLKSGLGGTFCHLDKRSPIILQKHPTYTAQLLLLGISLHYKKIPMVFINIYGIQLTV